MTSKEAYALTQKDLNWKPYYPNNMPCNGVDGYYCIIPVKNDDGTYAARKYTISFQHERTEEGFSTKNIELYILFEQTYGEVIGPLDYPEPDDKGCDCDCESCDIITFTACDVNNFGRFQRACKTIDEAKKLALDCFKMVYGYAASFIEE